MIDDEYLKILPLCLTTRKSICRRKIKKNPFKKGMAMYFLQEGLPTLF
jgi:hypothetical protein